jgi:threonylcarbamoyladenosine tRNA methylthiotransferase MtaB
MKVNITTLGCKINQFDSGVIRGKLLADGAEIVKDGEPADLYVINTCSVTKKSDYQCRQAIRRAVKQKGETGRVVVTGCYARTNPEEIKLIDGVDEVAGSLSDINISGARGKGSGIAQSISGRSRAFLKVQDGCDARCSYCVVPLSRGDGRSAPVQDVLERADELIGLGYHEIVLIGVQLGSYGREAGADASLSTLVERLLHRPGLGRLRLSSVEPMFFDPGLFELMGHEKLCRHFHIPLQSGEAGVLSSMGRSYSPDDYFTLIERISLTSPRACLGADVITGYPVEDKASFEETFKRIEGSPLNYLHVFSYSPRPGTRSFALGDPVHADEKKERTWRLRDLAERKNRAFRESFAGEVMTVVVEDKNRKVSGLTDNYIRVYFDGDGLASKAPVAVRIGDALEGGCAGVVL